MRLKVDCGRLNGNSHGTQPRGEPWNKGTKRSTVAIVPLGRSMYVKAEGRRMFGRRLWIYGPSGACVNLDAMVIFDKCPCAPGTKWGPQDDGGLGTVVL